MPRHYRYATAVCLLRWGDEHWLRIASIETVIVTLVFTLLVVHDAGHTTITVSRYCHDINIVWRQPREMNVTRCYRCFARYH